MTCGCVAILFVIFRTFGTIQLFEVTKKKTIIFKTISNIKYSHFSKKETIPFAKNIHQENSNLEWNFKVE